MKAALILEDTPAGLKSKLVWQPSGHQDHAADSIAMNVMANLTLFIKDMQDRKLLRIAPEKPNDPPEPAEAVVRP